MDNALENRRVIAVVPAYNERDNIVSTIEDLRDNAPGVDYVIVNDGSKDDTLSICREHGYDYAIQFDADGQHSAAFIAEMVHVAEEKGANIVIGSRFATQKKPVSARMAGSVLISAMIMLTTRKRIQDPTSGMRLFDKQMIPLFANELDFGPEPDTISLLMRWGYKVEETQVEMRERVAGESYLNFTKSVTYMLRMSISILLVQWFRRKK